MVKEKIKIVMLGDVLGKIQGDLSRSKRIGESLKEIYADNKVIAVIENHGETYFICEG